MFEFFKKIWEWLTTPQVPRTPDADSNVQPLPVPEPEGPSSFAEIEPALVYTLKNEGGYSDVPEDNGGATKYGITIGRLSEYLGRPATKTEVKTLTKEMAAIIYRKYYWDPLRLDRCDDQNIANCIFDMGVLCGPAKAAEWTQEILGVKVDRRVGPVTLAALNEALRSSFVPKFADKAQAYFNAIVASNPKQKKFLKGWTNRANRLRTLAVGEPKKDETPIATGEIGEGLVELAAANGLPVSRVREMIALQKKYRPGKNPKNWCMIDFGKHSKELRFYILDRINDVVIALHTSHGSGSDLDHNGLADKFSNVPGSNCSSLGFYYCEETYVGKHGTSLKLDGMEASNSNARARAIVIHSAEYVGPKYVAANGKCGRSQGCPAVGLSYINDVISRLKNGSPLYAFK